MSVRSRIAALEKAKATNAVKADWRVGLPDLSHLSDEELEAKFNEYLPLAHNPALDLLSDRELTDLYFQSLKNPSG
jgi:hypothetical protein